MNKTKVRFLDAENKDLIFIDVQHPDGTWTIEHHDLSIEEALDIVNECNYQIVE